MAASKTLAVPARKNQTLFQRYAFTLGMAVLLILVYQAQIWSINTYMTDRLIVCCAKVDAAIWQGQVWRLFTMLFLHQSWNHLMGNVFCLLVYGAWLETYLGSRRTAKIYFLCGLSGAVLSLLLEPRNSEGASLATFGLYAALTMVVLPRRDVPIVSKMILVLIAFIPGVFGLLGKSDVYGHMGGVIGGLLCGIHYGLQERNRLRMTTVSEMQPIPVTNPLEHTR
jgi:rhomboid protease GluP